MGIPGLLRRSILLIALVFTGIFLSEGPGYSFPVKKVRTVIEVEGVGFSFPCDVSVDRRGFFYLLDAGKKAVFIIDPAGRYSNYVKLDGKDVGVPEGIAVRYPGVFIIADSAKKSAMEFDMAGKRSGKWHIPASGRLVDLSSHGNRIFLLDGKKSTVYILDEGNREKEMFGTVGDHPGEFKYPFRIFIDDRGEIYITDVMNGRVQSMDFEGKNVNIIKSFGLARSRFMRPGGISGDGSRYLFITDMVSGIAFIYDLGKGVLEALEDSRGPIKFADPVSISYHGGYLGIVDQAGKAFHIYRINTSLMGG